MQLNLKSRNLIILSKRLNSVAVNRLLKKRSIRLYVPAGNPMGNVMLNAVLGQFAINSMEFQRKFLDISSNIDNDIPLQIEIDLLRNRSFILNLKNSAISFLFYEEFLIDSNILDFIDEDDYIYFQLINLSKIYLMVLYLSKYFFKNSNVRSLFKIVLSVLYSMHVSIFNDLS